MTTQAMIESDTFQAAFEALDTQSPLHELRSKGFERFRELGFPTRRDEDWRYTNIKPITSTSFTPASGSITKESITPYTLSDTPCHQMVFVNGRFDDELSDVGTLEAGVRLESIATISESSFDMIAPHLGSCSEIEREAFTALNTALLEDGLFLFVPRGVELDKPVHVIFITTLGSEAVATHPRILIVAEENSKATIIETYASDGGGGAGGCLTNPVTEIIVGENAIIDHYKIEQECDEAYHVSSLNVRQQRSSNVTSHNYSLGGRLVRNNLNCALDGEGCEATFNGLTIGHGRQLVDNYLRIDHNMPNCNSWEYYKTVLDDQSKGVFCGRIYVAPDAQKTDAKQTSMNLLLSEEASITTMPQLDIFADDVKCTHGATIGQIEETQLFYLQSRGIDKVSAKTLLIYAFANETIAEIKIEELQARIERILLDRLPQGELLQGGI